MTSRQILFTPLKITKFAWYARLFQPSEIQMLFLKFCFLSQTTKLNLRKAESFYLCFFFFLFFKQKLMWKWTKTHWRLKMSEGWAHRSRVAKPRPPTFCPQDLNLEKVWTVVNGKRQIIFLILFKLCRQSQIWCLSI